ncbi:MAG: GH1 family beta-glucosidase [Dermatophilaceae bacterium]
MTTAASGSAPATATRALPTGFVLGAATAAYQIEGAAFEDGRTASIWDTFARLPGAVLGADTGDVACDHYHRYREDVALMARLGLDSYRFSTSWARVCPDGGPVNTRGLDFYERLVDELLAHGITPWLTLYHWDLPQALEDRGGWTGRATSERFVDYALAVHDRLGDRVATWTTLNEPFCSAFLGYTGGIHAPGRTDPGAGLAAAHHLMLAHGLAVRALRERDPRLRLGITLNHTVPDPVDPHDPTDVDAARRLDAQMNRVFLDPLFRGAYPPDLLADVEGLGLDQVVQPSDLEVISTPIDVLGVNYYHGEAVSARPTTHPVETEAATGRPTRSPFPAPDGIHPHQRGLATTGMGWEIQPEGLTRLLLRLHEEYAGPAGTELYVTENGAAFPDEVAEDGAVHDPGRVAYLHDHLAAVLDAVDRGVPVKGYFSWSLLDNYEWSWGYSQRFGIVRVDYRTQERIIKDSGHFYARVIAARGLELPDGE